MMACPSRASWSCIVENNILFTWKRYLLKMFISNQMIFCMLKVGIQLMAALFFSVTVTSVTKVFEGPVWPLARNRMKKSAAMQYKNVGHRSRVIATLLGYTISFENV